MSASETGFIASDINIGSLLQSIVSLRNLRVAGERGRSLLTVDHLDIAKGQTVAIKGPSGAGKSTLLFALAGLANISDGSVCWHLADGDRDLAQLSEEQCASFRREYLGMVFQDFLLFEELDALANASIANSYLPAKDKQAVQSRAEQMLNHLGIKDVRKRSIASFSGGERQRVAIARALANDPQILLADEPTASLDRKAADSLIKDLIRLVREQGKTLIVVSHDVQLCEKMDRIVEVRDGRIFENRVDENGNVSIETGDLSKEEVA